MNIVIVGASKGLGRAFASGLGGPEDTVFGVARTQPPAFAHQAGQLCWIEADLSNPLIAVGQIAAALPPVVDVLIYNLGLWEAQAFSADYDFQEDDDLAIMTMVNSNVTATILLIKRLLPQLLASQRPRIILTGSTSALRQSGRPEVTFGATKTALNGIADALREGYRHQRLAVTTLQLGYLNTEDDLSVPLAQAALAGGGETIPLHDVVMMTNSLLQLSEATFVRELCLP
ncbi:MAG: SDR family oxidoreductase, partial [Neisseriaceae bacterium]|nr:SDR family oxidoreductase [Neisseriaceae bacterium]